MSGTTISETTVQYATHHDMLYPAVKAHITIFNNKLETWLDNTNFILITNTNNFTQDDDFSAPNRDPAYGNNTPTAEEYRLMATEHGSNETELESIKSEDLEDGEVVTYDKHISVKVVLDQESNNSGNLATVTRRVTNIHGRPVGIAKNNLQLDSREYKIELEDGTFDRIFAN